jgi:anti-anti-sigma factor
MDKFLKIVLLQESDEGTVRVLLQGQLTWPNIKQFQSEMNRLFSLGKKQIELDLRELSYLDSSGLAALIPIHTLFKQEGGCVVIRNPRRLIRHIFVSAHLDSVIDIGPEFSV